MAEGIEMVFGNTNASASALRKAFKADGGTGNDTSPGSKFAGDGSSREWN